MEPKHKYLPVLITVLVMLLISAGVGVGVWYYMDQQVKKTADDNANQVATLQKQVTDLKGSEKRSLLDSNIFKFETVKVGDQVAGLTVVSISKGMKQSDLPLGPENFEVAFSGELTVSGSYEYHGGDKPDISSDYFTFSPDTASQKRIPAIQNRPATLFWIENTNRAKSLFSVTTGKSKTGKATITIKDYKVIYVPTEGGDMATLISAKF